MYSESPADVFSGGGFMPSQSTAPFNNGDSSFTGTAKRNPQNTGLLPLTVKQLSMASQKPADDNFYVDGQEVNNIILVGTVNNKEEKVTDVSFQLDDYTGRIEVKKWIDGQDSEDVDLRALRNDVYVRVHGHLRSFQGKRNVVAFSVRIIEDFNEVTYHFLECVYVHLGPGAKTQGGPVAPKTPTSTGAYGAPPASGGTFNQDGRNQSSYNQYATPLARPLGAGSNNECAKRVKDIFEEPANMLDEGGVHTDEVVRRMTGFTRKQVCDAIEFLVGEGLIYSSIDENHHKSSRV